MTKVKHYAVVGNPITHSLSPKLHRLFAKQTHQAVQYDTCLVPTDSLASYLNELQAKGFQGINITLPFKQQAYQLTSNCSQRAHQAQAINTLSFLNSGERFGDNTDGFGLIQDLLSNLHWPIHNQRILILGAGGACHGIIGPLLAQQPLSITIANRHFDKAQRCAEQFGIDALPIAALSEQSFDLIVHASAAHWDDPHFTWLPSLAIKHSACYDLSYAATATPFLTWAKTQGCQQLADGLGMLIEQAAEAFYLWHGIRPKTKQYLIHRDNLYDQSF